MDNLTHALVGVALGDSVSRHDPKVRRIAIWTAVIASNLPDLDFLMTSLGGPGSLGYLLVHRGFSHTLLFAPVIAGVSVWIAKGVTRFKDKPQGWLYLLAWVSVLGHILADYCNNYGVHPFSPIWGKWIYGDSLFIVEPLVLFVLLPFSFFRTQNLWTKRGVVFLEILLAVLVGAQIFTTPLSSCLILVWAALFAMIQKRFQNILPVLGGLSFILVVFFSGSNRVKSELRSIVGNSKNAEFHQIVTTPAPGNPFCWSFLTLSTENQNEYVARKGVMSLLPSILPAETCYSKLDWNKSVLSPLSPPLGNNEGLFWIGEFRRPIEEFDSLKRNCLFKAFLKFARIPIWYTVNSSWFAEDLRYGREGRGNFTKLQVYPIANCPSEHFAWEPPTDAIR